MFALRLECLQQSSSEATPHCHTTTTAQFAQFCRPCHAAAPHATAPCHGIFGRITDAEENGEEEPWQKMDVSKNNVTPKSSTLIGFSLINHPFWGTPIFGNTQMEILQKMGPLPVQNWGVLFDTSSEPISFRRFADPFGIHTWILWESLRSHPHTTGRWAPGPFSTSFWRNFFLCGFWGCLGYLPVLRKWVITPYNPYISRLDTSRK